MCFRRLTYLHTWIPYRDYIIFSPPSPVLDPHSFGLRWAPNSVLIQQMTQLTGTTGAGFRLVPKFSKFSGSGSWFHFKNFRVSGPGTRPAPIPGYHLITSKIYIYHPNAFFQKYMHLLGFLYVWKFIRKYLCILHLGRSWPCQRLITGIMFTLSTRIWFTFYCWYNIIPGDLKSNGIVEKIWNPIIRIPINAPDFAKLMFEL